MTSKPQRAKEIFVELVGAVPSDEWDRRLDEACGGDPELRDRVSALLRAHVEPGSFLEQPAVAGSLPTIDQPITEHPGTHIGRYKLLEQIGEGGMGVVFMAEQEEPVRRKVALKIIKPGMDTKEVIGRFEAERQALAIMDHPSIAKVLDAGATESGRPFFVMELVRGIPITDFCDQNSLTARERLELFVSVCQAVRHPHQKGIIHRDIKPSNVMVTLRDDTPMAKVIDFGVAKATNARLTEQTLFTRFGQMVGTPLYMSPEQAGMSELDVDTRSDIYSLGVLLYELLTGATPFDQQRFREAAYDELLKIIREEEPPKPSLRISTLGDTLPSVAAHRKLEPKKLSALVRGELDWIVMKAMEKDRARRYTTATALGIDVQHYLNDAPVEACPPSSVYMIGKFARRNRRWLATAAAVLLTVFLGLTLSTILIARERDAAEESARSAEAAARREAIVAEEADRQRQRAEANLRETRAAVDRLFTRAAEELANHPHMTEVRRALLEDAAEFYEGFVEQKSDDPEIRREMGRAYQRLGFAYEFLGRHEEAVAVTRQAAAAYEQLSRDYPGEEDYRIQLADSFNELAVRLKRSGRAEESVATARKSIEIAEELARRHPTVPRYRRKAARLPVDIANQMGDTPGSEYERVELCRKSLSLWEKFREDFPDLELLPFEEGHTYHWLGSNLMKVGQYEEAEIHLRRSHDIRKQLRARAPHDIHRQHLLAHIEIYLATALLQRGASEEAERVIRSAQDLLQPLVNDFPGVPEYRQHLRATYNVHAQILLSQQRFEEAEETRLRSIEILRLEPAANLTNAYELAWALYDLALLQYHRGDTQRTADTLRQAFADFERVLNESEPELSLHARAENALRWTLITCPLPQFRDAGRSIGFSRGLLQHNPLSHEDWNALGIGYYRAGNWDKAIEALTKSAELREKSDRSDCYFLAMAHWRRGEQEKAHEWYQRGIQLESDTAMAFDLDLINFRREAQKLLGIAEDVARAVSQPEPEPREDISSNENADERGERD